MLGSGKRDREFSEFVLNRRSPSADPADTTPIVAAPSVTLDGLIAAVTDPAFTLKRY
ncbi:MAG: hypothetical protein QOG10_1747 [Kribbellaceae bacterium]|nr:hypothetical protein [Kribbellaceae bacterium]